MTVRIPPAYLPHRVRSRSYGRDTSGGQTCHTLPTPELTAADDKLWRACTGLEYIRSRVGSSPCDCAIAGSEGSPDPPRIQDLNGSLSSARSPAGPWAENRPESPGSLSAPQTPSATQAKRVWMLEGDAPCSGSQAEDMYRCCGMRCMYALIGACHPAMYIAYECQHETTD